MQCLTQLNATDFQVLAIQPDTYTACTFILVQPLELQTQVFNITAAEGLQLSAAIVAVWTIGFVVRLYKQSLNIDEKE